MSETHTNICPDALAAELMDVDTYTRRVGLRECLLPACFGSIIYQRGAEILMLSQTPYHHSVGLLAYVRCFFDLKRAIVFPDGRSESLRDAIVEVIRINPMLGHAFYVLGIFLKAQHRKRAARYENRIRLHDGRVITGLGAALEAIRLCPNMSKYYRYLAFCMATEQKQTIRLFDGRVFSSDGLLVEAIRLAPLDATAYLDVAAALSLVHEIKLCDGRVMNRYTFALEAVRLAPSLSEAWFQLSISVPRTMLSIDVHGKSYTRRDLQLQAQHFDPTSFTPYLMLARGPEFGNNCDVVTLHNGCVLTRAELFVLAVKFDQGRRVPYALVNMDPADKSMCYWRCCHHSAFGDGANTVFAAFLMCLARLRRCGLCVDMDPALVEESLQQWSLLDTCQLCV